MLVIIRQEILSDTVGSGITRIVFTNRDLNAKFDCAVGIEHCIVRPGINLIKICDKVHQTKNILPVDPIDLLDLLRLIIDDRFNRVVNAESQVAIKDRDIQLVLRRVSLAWIGIERTTNHVELILVTDIINTIDPVNIRILVSKENDMIIQYIPTDECALDWHIRSEHNLLVTTLIRDRKRCFIVPLKDTDIVIFIRRRLARLGNGQVPVHTLIV